MSKGRNGDRWSRGFNKAVNSITHTPRNKINSVKQTIHEEMIPLQHDVDDLAQSVKDGVYNVQDGIKSGVNTVKSGVDSVKTGVNNVKDGVKNTASAIGDIAHAKGFKGKMGALGNHIKGSDTAKKVMEMVKKAADAAKWVVANIKPIAIVSAVLLVLGNATIFIIGVIQSATPTPHYYCNTEATSSIKKTAVYQQYCTDASSFELENLNGHYIIQDGSGPCTDCSYNNMFMRYYTLAGINYFDYLWREDGMYAPEGQTLESTLLTTPGTIRRVINGGAEGTTDTSCNTGLANGSYAFASRNGKTLTMANWGYLRDSSLDIAAYEQTSDYYLDNAASDKWVFDLSLNNRAAGTTWSVFWEYTVKVSDFPCIVVSIEGSAITGDVIKNILAGQNDAVGEAGVVLYYDYDGDQLADHAILLTGYDESTGYWRVIDSAKGLNGGYEGPMDSSRHFAIHDAELNNLLKSGNNQSGNFKLCRISYCSINLI